MSQPNEPTDPDGRADDPREPGPPPDPRVARNEALAVFGGVTVFCAALYWIGMGVGLFRSSFLGFQAAVSPEGWQFYVGIQPIVERSSRRLR